MAAVRMSALFLRTLRDDPADADVPSHKLLVRAGCVRRVAPGVYTWLPFGKRVLDNVARIVREEMDAIGAQEVLFPALLPRDYFEATGRWTEYGDNIFRLKDRKGADYLLGPTHEEMFTTLVKSEYSSYKDLPLSLYQIQTKYRDEARPRAGILRGREFVMKDSYSFDLSDEGLQASYDAHRGAYEKTFARLGLDFKTVFAVAGPMGGSGSEEFLAKTEYGEDSYVACTSCDYAANVEAVETAPPAAVETDHPAIEVLDTPDTPTIETLVNLLRDKGYDVTAADTLKNVVVLLRTPGRDDEVLIVGVPGDREVDLKRLEANVYPAEVVAFEDFDKHPELVRGYIGPQGLPDSVRYAVDPLVAKGTAWVTGANVEGRHAVNVVAGRDFSVAEVIPAAEVRAGDPCPRCGNALSIDRGIEIGHIFQLGRKFTNAFELDVLGPDGKPIRVTMGSYGIGVSRAVAAIVEQHHDDKGIVWPRSVAPFAVHLVPVGKDAEPLEVATRLATELSERGLDVLLDDRDTSAGVKFADADLLGAPTIVTVGKALKDGQVEVKDRASGERSLVAVDDLVATVLGTR
jgi:prolyl-tRNA synthetase